MIKLTNTEHAALRLAQRGLSADDTDLIVQVGSEVPDGYLLQHRDVLALTKTLNRLRDRVQRLEGVRVVIGGEHLVTSYHATPRTQKRLRRHALNRGMQ